MWFLRLLRCVLFYGVLCVVLQLREVSAAVGDYTHEWAVKIDGGDLQAEAVASEQNYELVDKVKYRSSSVGYVWITSAGTCLLVNGGIAQLRNLL